MLNPQPLVAVVDDDAPVRTSLSRLLRSSGFAVTTFESGDAFLDGLDASHPAPVPDCLVLDLHMPGRNGFAVCAALRGARRRIPIIMITGKEEADTAAQARVAGAGVLLTKPFDELELLSAVHASLHRPEL